MIISASRRTDIPALYSEWLVNRLREGYVLVPQVYNSKKLSSIALNPYVVDCIVFWTKNPIPMMDKIKLIQDMGYQFYYQFTLTPYGKNIEKNLPSKDILVDSFKRLGSIIGADRMVWRYDPVIITDNMNLNWHIENFTRLCSELKGSTNRCIFSFLDFYSKRRQAIESLGAYNIKEVDMQALGKAFSKIAQSYSIKLYTCCEPVDLSAFNISHASCIDKSLIEEIIGCRLKLQRDSNQRPACGCFESIDIGVYDSCSNGCIYCYGTFSEIHRDKNISSHNKSAPVLIGNGNDCCINDRKAESNKDPQLTMF